MKVMNEENQNFTDYVSQIDETQLATDYASKLSNNEVLYDSAFGSDSIESVAVYHNESAAVCNLNECSINSCDFDDGELTCGDDFADNGDTIQGGPCQDLMEYFSDKPYLD